MPFAFTAADLALIHMPLPHHVPRGSRRIEDPALEALVASRWHSRRCWEADGYVFPDHPRPRVPRHLRRDFPDLAAEDDARDVEAARRTAEEARPDPEPTLAAPAPALPFDPALDARPSPAAGGRGLPGPSRPLRPSLRATALARRDARRAGGRPLAGALRTRDTWGHGSPRAGTTEPRRGPALRRPNRTRSHDRRRPTQERPVTRVLVTGSAGFIGFHLSRLLLAEGFAVHGYDGMTDYYDVALKRRRHAILLQNPAFAATEARLEDREAFARAAEAVRPEVIVHLAAQAGVRHSLEAPLDYLESNVIGTLTVLEAARRHAVRHLLMASTSSVYGANALMPFHETHKADAQLTIYAASKKANESMGHAWAHLYDVPTTMFRFFTVYGPWGRPDLALYRFVDAILDGRPIDIYNHGEMFRDFTYVEDLVRAIRLLIDVPPVRPPDGEVPEGDSLSPVAPFRVVNIGNSEKVRLLDFVEAIEDCLGVRAIRNPLPMQPGDVPATWADASLLQRLTGYRPRTELRDGIARFVDWYRDYSGK